MLKRIVPSQYVAAAIALYFATVLNLAFWRFVWRHLDIEGAQGVAFAAAIPICLFLITYAVVSLLLWPYVGKAVFGVLLVASAGANYFMFRLNVFIDSEMIRNVFDTNLREAREMVTFEGLLWVVGMGVVPAALLLLVRIAYRSPLREIGFRLVNILCALVLAAGLGLVFYKDFAANVRNNKSVSKLINPGNYLVSIRRYFHKRAKANREFAVIDEDPLHEPYEDPYLTVLIVIVGETARAANFSLGGYERETNPKLSKQDIIYFTDVTSSGTATAFSVPCMFSQLPRSKFNIDIAEQSENLLDVVQKAGYDVVWLDNDGGSKGVADRVEYVDLMRDGNPEFRNGDTFYDEVLLDGLEERLRNIRKDTLIVLHMMGSHGPSYYRRYPDAFRVFTPTCDTAEIQTRPREEIVNTYDNTILYSDHVISGVIDIMKKFPGFECGVLYVSDHGESLGENGLYLHGFPYALAPREQVHVPMILWMSETMRREDHVDYEKLGLAADRPLSHDHLFHSVIGLVEIDTDLYDPDLDLFRDFRTKPLPRRSQ
jgi:lipid A ethanolaminephosphotransferase